MIIGVDASNIRGGGGVTHLCKVLAYCDAESLGIDKVVVWAGKETACKLPQRRWLELHCLRVLDGPLPARVMWQQLVLPTLLKLNRCDVLFSPGGTIPLLSRHRVITMFRNLLPFAAEERARFHDRSEAVAPKRVTFSQNLLPFSSADIRSLGWALWLKMIVLRFAQGRSFRTADGTVFLNDYAKSIIGDALGHKEITSKIVAHGVEERFRMKPRQQRPICTYSPDDPFKLLYVSMVNVYKHQWNVARAVASLRTKGYPITLDLVGAAVAPAIDRLNAELRSVDPNGEFIHYRGPVRFDDLHRTYHKADAFVFASTCENMPNIVLEAMAAGLPVVCSNCEPMTSMLGDGGVYCNALDPSDIAAALEEMLNDTDLRAVCARRSYERSMQYSWDRCAESTFRFLIDVGSGNCIC